MRSVPFLFLAGQLDIFHVVRSKEAIQPAERIVLIQSSEYFTNLDVCAGIPAIFAMLLH